MSTWVPTYGLRGVNHICSSPKQPTFVTGVPSSAGGTGGGCTTAGAGIMAGLEPPGATPGEAVCVADRAVAVVATWVDCKAIWVALRAVAVAATAVAVWATGGESGSVVT